MTLLVLMRSLERSGEEVEAEVLPYFKKKIEAGVVCAKVLRGVSGANFAESKQAKKHIDIYKAYFLQGIYQQ